MRVTQTQCTTDKASRISMLKCSEHPNHKIVNTPYIKAQRARQGHETNTYVQTTVVRYIHIPIRKHGSLRTDVPSGLNKEQAANTRA